MIPTASILHHHNLKKQVILETDSFESIKSGVLFQYNNHSILYSVAFHSKSIIVAKYIYHIYDKKLLAIIYCLEH